MKKLSLCLLVLFASAGVHAGPQSDELTRCFANSTTGKDRTDLARWVFVGMASHPDMAAVTSISPATRESASKAIGTLFTRLVAESCAVETKAAVQAEGQKALRSGFEVLGRLAMQELMANPNVAAAFSAPEKYIDRAKVTAALQPN